MEMMYMIVWPGQQLLGNNWLTHVNMEKGHKNDDDDDTFLMFETRQAGFF